MLVWKAALLTLISFGVGVLGGFVGLALGSIRLPALLLLGVTPTMAAGTNIMTSTLGALAGGVRHLRERRVDSRVVLAMGVPSLAGAFIGGYYSAQLPHSFLAAVVGVLVIWQGVEFIQKVGPGLQAGSPAGAASADTTDVRVMARAGGIGLVVGVIGGAVGLILGSLRLPALLRLLRLPPPTAAGTNMLIGSLMGTTGWAGHLVRGHVDYPLLALLAGAAMAGSYIGARFTGQVELGRLIASMGAVLIAVGALLIVRAALEFLLGL